MPLFTEWSCASSFEVILARQSSHFLTWTSASRTSGSRCIFHILLRGRSWRKIGCVDFTRLFKSYRKLQLSPFEHCPFAFHCQQSPGLLCSRCFILGFLTTALLFQNFHFWPQNYSFANSARDFFLPLSSICDNQVQPSSDESPYCTIPIRS